MRTACLLLLTTIIGANPFTVTRSTPGYSVQRVTSNNPWYPTPPAAKPEMIFLTAAWCIEPCRPVKEDIKAGKFTEFEMRTVDIETGQPPIQVDTVPAFYWKSPDGRAWQYPDPREKRIDRRGYPGAEQLIAMWLATQQPPAKARSELDGLTPQQRAAVDAALKAGWSIDQIRDYARRRGLIDQ